ncbi:NAD(P)H-binding protein, partial [Novosphingobium sp.]|uniref:NAD(P)H-binding protein n=1 Tax=Novosphingobium sp. TaxID=1874826 RepID=UPI00262D2077
MFAVTGATGQLGQRVIARLVENVPPEQIVAIVRDPAKAASLLPAGVIIRQAAYDEPAQLSAALQGVTRLLLISSSEIGQRVGKHGNVISAAVAAGVGFLIYTSLLHADGSTIGLAGEHRATEALIAQSGLPHAILRNGWYLENYLAGAGPALQHGAMIGSGGEGRISAATRDDYAEAAARLLSNPPAAGSVLELAGDEAFTEAEFTAALAAAAGKPV